VPNQTRWRIKRVLEQVELNIKKAQEYLTTEAQLFKDVHKDIYDTFCSIVTALEVILPCISKLKESI
jgi:hypothetical protein